MRAHLGSLDLRACFAHTRDHDSGRIGIAAPDELEQIHSGPSRQQDIDKGEIELPRTQLDQRGVNAPRCHTLVSFLLQDGSQYFLDIDLVINHQDGAFTFVHEAAHSVQYLFDIVRYSRATGHSGHTGHGSGSLASDGNSGQVPNNDLAQPSCKSDANLLWWGNASVSRVERDEIRTQRRTPASGPEVTG